MIDILISFKDKFEQRFNKYSILNIGEDSVRYDFFTALMEVKKLQSHQIQVEYPIHDDAYIKRNTKNSKRHENPQIDLYCELEDTKITVEFGLFKRNSNPKGNINITGKQFKMLNDFLRLSLNKIYQNNESYFICVADAKILDKKMEYDVLPKFPSENYSFDYIKIKDWIDNSRTAESTFDDRFFQKAVKLKLGIKATKIFDESLNRPAMISDNDLETRILVYKIECNALKN